MGGSRASLSEEKKEKHKGFASYEAAKYNPQDLGAIYPHHINYSIGAPGPFPAISNGLMKADY